MRFGYLSLTALLAPLAAPMPAGGQPAVAEYEAAYEVRYRGRRVAEASFVLASDGLGEYSFESRTRARGLFRLRAPNPAIERSRFMVASTGLRPLSFEFEDGSRRASESYSLDFDANAGEIRISGPSGNSALTLEAGLLDRGSLQVALMLDLGRCQVPGPYRWVDPDGVRTYHYERLGDLPTETGAGTFTTVRFAQQREGSSRSTVLWLAPRLAHLPVKVEQIRDGEAQTVLLLESLSGIERGPSHCSDYR